MRDKAKATLVTSPVQMSELLTSPNKLILPPSPQIVTGSVTSVHGGAKAGPWAEEVHREWLERLPVQDRRVLDSFVQWVGPAASWQTFFTFTWSDEYAAEHKGLFGARGSVRWVQNFLEDDLDYHGSLVLSPEGHRWRDVWHVHGLAERFSWKDALYEYAKETKSRNGLDLKRAVPEAVPYVMKYALKDDSVHQFIRLNESRR